MVKVLKGDEVYATITVGDQRLEYKGARAGQFYYLFSVGGVNGTCSPEFKEAFRSGKVDSVSYSETEYQPVGPDGQPRVDPVTGTAMTKRKSLSFGGYETLDQKIARLGGQKDLIKAEAALEATKKVAGKIAERTAYQEAGIDQAEMLELMKLV